MTNDELFDNFIFEFIFIHFLKIIWTSKIINNFPNCQILKIR